MYKRQIVGTHGVRGDLKVQSWCDSPEVLCDFDTVSYTHLDVYKRQMQSLLLVAIVLTLGVGLVCSYLVSRGLAHPIRQLSEIGRAHV